MRTNPTALLIIRAWAEPGSSKPLRAHVRLTTNVSSGMTSELTLADAEAVGDTVKAWLSDVLRDARQN